MAKLVDLDRRDEDGGTIGINPDHVETVERNRDEDEDDPECIVAVGKPARRIIVKGTYEEVRKKLGM